MSNVQLCHILLIDVFMDWDLLRQEFYNEQLSSYVEIWRGRGKQIIYWIQIMRLVMFEDRCWDFNSFSKMGVK
jgi:hypothetical protein